MALSSRAPSVPVNKYRGARPSHGHCQLQIDQLVLHRPHRITEKELKDSTETWAGDLILNSSFVMNNLCDCYSSLGCCKKVSQTGWFRQQKCIVSQFWRLDIQNQEDGSFGSFWGPWEKNAGLFLVCRWPSSPWVFTLSFSLHLCSSLFWTPILLNKDPPQWPNCNLITSGKTLSSNRVSIWSSRD